MAAKTEITLDFSKQINKEYQKYYYNKIRQLWFFGGAGTGKSFFAHQKILLRCIVEKNHNFIIVRKTLKSLKKSCIPLFKHILDINGLPYTENKTEAVLNLNFCNSSLAFIGVGIGEGGIERIKSIFGITGIFVEELTELTEDEYMQLCLRLRGKMKNYQQILTCFNPILTLTSGWIKKNYFDKEIKKEDIEIVKTDIEWNNEIDDNYKNVLNSLTGVNKKIYSDGDWADVEGKIYNNYKAQELTDEEIKNLLTKNIFFGLDFGFTNSSALLLLAEIDNKVYVLDELYKSQMLISEIIQYQKALCEKHNISKRVVTYCDSASPDKIKEGVNAGLNWKKSNKDITFGISKVKEFNIVIDSSCINLLKELETYAYQKDSDLPVKENDHACDAMRYAIATHLTGKQRIIKRNY